MAGNGLNRVAADLPEFLIAQRWFGGKARRMRSAEVLDSAELAAGDPSSTARLAVVRVQYDDGPPETYLTPLATASSRPDASSQSASPQSASPQTAGQQSSSPPSHRPLFDLASHEPFWDRLHEWIATERTVVTTHGRLVARRYAAYDRIRGGHRSPLAIRVLRADHSNSAAVLGERFLLKLFRKTEPGENPELEVSQFLSDLAGFAHVPALAGSIEYHDTAGSRLSVAVLHEYLVGSRPAWDVTLDEFGRFVTNVASEPASSESAPGETSSGETAGAAPTHDRPNDDGLADGAWRDPRGFTPRAAVRRTVGEFLDGAALLGRRTAQLHLALGSRDDHEAFAPESFGAVDQRRLYESLRDHAGRVLRALESRAASLPERSRDDARAVLALESQILDRFRGVLDRPLASRRIRCHGDYHLGQVLSTNGDFAIIDFEGEPMRSLAERRAKRSPLCDVAGMIRSFHYASHVGLQNAAAAGGTPTLTSVERLARWGRCWFQAVAAAFLSAYHRQIDGSPIAPPTDDEFSCLLDTFLLEKALYEVHYELNNRPDWIGIPLRGVLDVMSTPSSAAARTLR